MGLDLDHANKIVKWAEDETDRSKAPNTLERQQVIFTIAQVHLQRLQVEQNEEITALLKDLREGIFKLDWVTKVLEGIGSKPNEEKEDETISSVPKVW
jgi:hypothetical protein